MSSLPKSCCLDPLVLSGTLRGNIEYFDKEEKRVKWYYTTPQQSTSKSDKALVIFYDVFGFNLPNPKILADQFADQLGIDVYVPNYLPNAPPIEPFVPILDLSPHQHALSGLTKWKRIGLTIWAYVSCLPQLLDVLDWTAYPRAKHAIEELGQKYTSLGVTGYCRGGAIVIRLLSEHVKPIACGMINHPGPITMSQWDKIDVPSRWNLADEDNFIKEDQIGRLVQLSKEKGAKGIVLEHKLYPETTHGFASRPNTSHPPSKAAFEEINDTVTTFFNAHLLGRTGAGTEHA